MAKPDALYVSDQVEAVLQRLYSTDIGTARRIDALLDVLDRDHGDVRVRQRLWRSPTSWGFDVPGRDNDWTVLWRLVTEPDGRDTVDVERIEANISA